MRSSSKVLWVRKSDSFYHFYTAKPERKKSEGHHGHFYYTPDSLESLCIREANEHFPSLKALDLRKGRTVKVRLTFTAAL